MKNKLQFSVIVPAFNAEKTIASSIESVLSQTVDDFEIIICNDASTDRTAKVVRSFSDKRIVVIENKLNLGEGKTRDRAISIARGNWLAVLDADDAWLPRRLEKLLAATESNSLQSQMIFDNIMICHDAPGGLVAWQPIRSKHAFKAFGSESVDVPFKNFIRSDRLLIKPIIPTSFVQKLRIRHSEKKFAADIEFFIRLIHAGLKLRYIPEALYLYRVTPGSATAAASSSVHLMRECIEECAEYGWNDPEVLDAFLYKIRSLRDNEALYALAAKMRSGNFAAAIRVVMNNPSILRILPRRLSRHLAYQTHRILHSGHSR